MPPPTPSAARRASKPPKARESDTVSELSESIPKPLKPDRRQKALPVDDGFDIMLRDDEGPRFQLIPVDQIEASPHNPRVTFDEAKIAKLAESIAQHGVIQPITVRPRKSPGEKYEIAFGERRYRACLVAKLTVVPCIVEDARERDETSLSILQLMENRDREDLNVLDEAFAFAHGGASIDKGGGGLTQTELARQLGVTQGHVSNRVRLLKLPVEFRKRLISGEMTAEQGRDLVPWADLPEVCEAAWAHHRKYPFHGMVWSIRNAMHDLYVDLWRLSAGERKKHADEWGIRELQIEKNEVNYYATTNLDAARAFIEAKSAPLVTSPEKPEAEKGQSDEQKAAVFNKKVWRYLVGWWQRSLIEAYELGVDQVVVLRWALFFARQAEGTHDRENTLFDVLLRKKAVKGEHIDDPGLLRALAKQDPLPLLRETMGEWIKAEFTGSRPPLDPEVIVELAQQAGVKLADWRLDEEYLALLTREQLLDLIDEQGLMVDEEAKDGKRGDLVSALAKWCDGRSRPIPESIKNVKPVSLW